MNNTIYIQQNDSLSGIQYLFLLCYEAEKKFQMPNTKNLYLNNFTQKVGAIRTVINILRK